MGRGGGGGENTDTTPYVQWAIEKKVPHMWILYESLSHRFFFGNMCHTCTWGGGGDVQGSSSSGLSESKNSTCVKGKWPTFPCSSPSHWPFMFIFVTLMISPTCKRGKKTAMKMMAKKIHRNIIKEEKKKQSCQPWRFFLSQTYFEPETYYWMK